MSTNINITVGGDELLERAAQLQTANRQAKLESDADKKLSTQAAAERETALAAQGKDANGNPLSGANRANGAFASGLASSTSSLYGNRFQQPDIDRRPAANRSGSESVLGVEWRIEFSPLETTAMSSIDQTETMTLTVGPPGHAATASVDIPNSRRAALVPSYFSLTINEDRLFMLPLGNNSCIFVYHRNFLRSVDFVNIGGGKESFDSYGTYAFFVNRTTAKVIAAPDALKANLSDIFPPVTVNATRVQCLVQAPGGACLSSVTVDDFNQLLWGDESRYGRAVVYRTTSPIGRATVLALQYGILNVDAANSFDFFKNYLNYFTPAVFRFIKGPMTLDASALQYETMRSTYFPMAPRYFLKRCVLESTCTEAKTGFDLTRAQPVDLDTAISESEFRAVPKYDVPLNGYEQTGSWLFSFGSLRYPGLAFGWDWANPGYCRNQALSLGFTGADLKP